MIEKTMKQYEYDAVIVEDPDSGGKGRVKVNATFDGIEYAGSIVNMGVRNEDGSICYIIGVLKSIRKQLGKADGDTIHVVIKERK